MQGLEKGGNSSLLFGQVALLNVLLVLTESYFALLMIYLAHDLPEHLPVRQVRMKSYFPRRKIILSWTMGQPYYVRKGDLG